MSALYRIPDEPLATQPRGIVVDPFWALLGIMLGGAWLGAVVFAINAWSIRGPTWDRELKLIACMLLGAAVLGSAILLSGMGAPALKYAELVVIAWKLALAYWVYHLQHTGFALFQYFGGKVQNGLLIVLVGTLVLRGPILRALDHPVWYMMVS